MYKKGVYRGGKVHYWEPMVHVLSNGGWEKGWSGTKSFGGKQSCDVNNLDWWPKPNQEVQFEIINDCAHIKSLGKVLSSEEADRYCNFL